MLPMVWQEQQKRNNVLIFLALFAGLALIYIMFDILQFGTLSTMFNNLGVPLGIVHVMLNTMMAFLTAGMMSLSQIKLRLTSVEPKGSNSIPVLSFIFAILTFGCAPCVVAFLAAFGIAFTPLVLPHGNLAWKLALLVFIALASVYILYSVHKSTCPVKLKDKQTN